MVAEDMRQLGQRQRTFVLTENYSQKEYQFFLQEEKPPFPQQQKKETSAHTANFITREEPWIQEPKSFIVGSKPACPFLQRNNTSTFKGCLLRTFFKR